MSRGPEGGVQPVAAGVHSALIVLGNGVVGAALLRLLATPAASALRLVGLANSRSQCLAAGGLDLAQAASQLAAAPPGRDDEALIGALDASGCEHRIIVDATASAEEAARHAPWLLAGYHVVTANKSLAGGELAGWRSLQAVFRQGGRYGDSATVGAGLPILPTLRRLHACGDALLTLEGVFSGSLSYLFNQYDGRIPFSSLLLEARSLGYTEPDPRTDLSGADVARKLLILARVAGFALGHDEVEVENLVPPALREVSTAAFLQGLAPLDQILSRRCAEAAGRGHVLRYLARLNQRGKAKVGLVEVAADHPAARLYGTDNQFALTTTRYHTQPLVIQGPGAGPEVTAQALLGDILALHPFV